MNLIVKCYQIFTLQFIHVTAKLNFQLLYFGVKQTILKANNNKKKNLEIVKKCDGSVFLSETTSQTRKKCKVGLGQKMIGLL